MDANTSRRNGTNILHRNCERKRERKREKKREREKETMLISYGFSSMFVHWK